MAYRREVDREERMADRERRGRGRREGRKSACVVVWTKRCIDPMSPAFMTSLIAKMTYLCLYVHDPSNIQHSN